MAYEAQQIAHSFPSAATLASSQYLFGLLNSSGNIAVNTVAGGFCTGVIQDNSSVVGAASKVALLGITKVVAGAAITCGAQIMSNASGQAVTCTSGGASMGQALQTASGANSIIAMLLTGHGRP